MFRIQYKPNKNWVFVCEPCLICVKENNPYYKYFLEAKKKYKENNYHPQLFKFGNELRKKTVVEHLDIPEEKIKFYRHEDCHKVYGFHSSVKNDKEALVFTLEGLGDDSSATVSRVDKKSIDEYWGSSDGCSDAAGRNVWRKEKLVAAASAATRAATSSNRSVSARRLSSATLSATHSRFVS